MTVNYDRKLNHLQCSHVFVPFTLVSDSEYTPYNISSSDEKLIELSTVNDLYV
jgi:hypothetical protein